MNTTITSYLGTGQKFTIKNGVMVVEGGGGCTISASWQEDVDLSATVKKVIIKGTIQSVFIDGLKFVKTIYIEDGVLSSVQISDCLRLRNLRLPEGIEDIASLSHLWVLKELNVPSSVKRIGFMNHMYLLEQINFPEDSCLEEISINIDCMFSLKTLRVRKGTKQINISEDGVLEDLYAPKKIVRFHRKTHSYKVHGY